MFTGFCNTGTWGSLGNFSGWGWIGSIVSVVFLMALLVGLTLFVVRATQHTRVPAATGQKVAQEILQARFARGEITREQYELMKQDIG